MSPNKYTHYYVKNGTIIVSSSPGTADTANKTLILLGDCKFKLGNALFNSDHDFNFTGEGALSFEGGGVTVQGKVMAESRHIQKSGGISMGEFGPAQ